MWRIYEQHEARMTREGGKNSHISSLLRRHGVPVDLIHDVLRLHNEDEKWLRTSSSGTLGGSLARIPVSVWREHVCPFLDDSWRGWAKLARVSKGWLLHFRFARSLSGLPDQKLDPSRLRRSGLRLQQALRKLEQIRGFDDTDVQQLLASLRGLQTLDLSFCSAITDEGVHALASLVSLQTLNLSFCTAITDEGVDALASLV